MESITGEHGFGYLERNIEGTASKAYILKPNISLIFERRCELTYEIFVLARVAGRLFDFTAQARFFQLLLEIIRVQAAKDDGGSLKILGGENFHKSGIPGFKRFV